MKKNLLITLFLSMSLLKLNAQPGGVGDLTGNSILKLWVTSQSANVNTNNTPVDTLYDLSGANNHLIADSASVRPLLLTNQLNGYPAISFNGIDQYLHDVAYDSSFYNDEATLIAVLPRQSLGTIVSIASTDVDEEFLLLSGKAYHHSFNFNYTYLDHDCNAIDTLSPYCILTGEFGKTTSDLSLYYNHVASTQLVQSNNTPIDYTQINRLIYIGNRQQFLPSEYFNSKLVELIGYNRKLTNTERDSVLNYLTNRYLLPVSCGVASSTEEVDEKSDIHMYPNPAHDLINISMTSAENRDANLTIINVLGKTIYSASMDLLSGENKAKVDCSTWANGIYFLQVRSNDSSISETIVVE